MKMKELKKKPGIAASMVKYPNMPALLLIDKLN